MDQQFIDISQLDQEKLLKLADEKFEKYELQDATYYYEEAVRKNPDSDICLIAYGEFLKHTDEVEKAEFVFERAIQLHPNTNLKKYFQLAELKDGKDSLLLYEKGVELLEKQQQMLKPEEIKDLCNAYAAIAELYQTDFVQYKESEEKVTSNIEKALKFDPENLDAKMQLANYWLNKEDEEKAKEPLLFVYETLKVTDLEQEVVSMDQENQNGQNQNQNNGNLENQGQSSQNINFNKKYKYNSDSVTQSFKLNVAKVLMEVELLDQSLIMLQHLSELDSDNKEYLYLLSYVNFRQQNYYTSLEQVEELLNKNFDEEDGMDQEILAAAKELKNEISKIDLKSSKDGVMTKEEEQQLEMIKKAMQENGQDEDDFEWSDCEEEEENMEQQ
ncbi:hypothetical protein PPERSA_06124 [Pseudocohnilembus persalinus]|uniref:Uncharacterized protein n=1 Tax=Pseudocohnilembus persalinus TaxID=266149 RepID=A0A0V0QVI9_PSEPJ|nr:hypothetical protein PPERSA_06124 [Pseudocohnilembus persalinus]|eukprot:KRX06242.1 hypothetical protein PPERSA_06124 [Pseudocohnilembus persalinus]